jgi:hypothetical protein
MSAGVAPVVGLIGEGAIEVVGLIDESSREGDWLGGWRIPRGVGVSALVGVGTFGHGLLYTITPFELQSIIQTIKEVSQKPNGKNVKAGRVL